MKSKHIAPFFIAITFIMIGMFSASAYADTASITYVAPTEREDNTPLAPSEIAGFKVYDSDGALVKQLASDARGFDQTTTSVIQSLFITTIDTDGRESVYSQEATIPATIANPKPVTGITVTVSP
jgi:hypothetical protein